MSIHHDKLITDTIGIDVILSVLESGHSVELPATGYSMFPVLRPGDKALVNPLPKGALPVVGSVIVGMAQTAGSRAQGEEKKAQGSGLRAQGEEQKVEGERQKAEVDEWNEEILHSGSGKRKPQTACRIPHTVLVMHRLVEIQKEDSGNFLLITRGDSMAENDLPWHQDQIIGSVDSFTRKSSRYKIKIKVPFKLEYKINRLLLWIWLKSGNRQK